MDGIVAGIDGSEEGTAAATDTDAIAMISSSCDVIEAAPTPSSCVLAVAGAATELSSAMEQAEEHEMEVEMHEQLQPEVEEEGQEEEGALADQQKEEQELEEQQQQEENELEEQQQHEEEQFDDQQQEEMQPMEAQQELQTGESEEQQQDEQVEEESSATTQTRQNISLPWDFTAAELCRSCGKPNTELYELFEQEQVEQKSSNTNIGDVDSEDINIDESNNSGNKNPRVSATVATETTSAANQQQQQQQNKMFNILQDMQIWQLRIKSNDGLPQRICPKCTAQFSIIGKFRRKCLKVQIRLRAMYEERQLEEQQFLQSLDDKDVNLNIPPVLDIGNDLINDNYGQPLSEVELFETNWNAAESTHNGSLSHELLVNETVKSTMNAQDNDADSDALQAAGAVSCPVLNELEDVIKATTDCPELVLDSNTSLVNSIDLEVNANIDEESLLDTQTIFKTNTKKHTTCNTAAQDSSEIHINENLPLLLQADSAAPNSYYVKDDLNFLITNQSKCIPVPKQNENLTKNKVEIISIENLDNFDLLTTPTTSKQAAAIQNMEVDGSTFELSQPKALENKNFHELPNYNDQEDCYKEERTHLHELLENKNISEQELLPINEPNKEQVFDLISLQKELLTKVAVETTERPGLSVSQSRTRNVSDEGMKFVSKGALKEYSSSPISHNDAQISSVYTQTTDPCCSKQAYAFKALISPQRQLLRAESVAKRKSGEILLKTALAPISDIDPQNDTLVPYAQKRKKTKSRAKPASLKRKQQQHELVIAKAKLLQQTCECSVRLCRLSARKLFILQAAGGFSGIDSAQDQKIKNLYETDTTSIINTNQTTQYQQQFDDAVVNNVVSNKKYKLSPQPDSPLVHSSRKRIPHWKTKAEMKANIVDNVVLRKTSLRRKLNLDLDSSKKRCTLKTKTSFSNDVHECSKNAESVEQEHSEPLAVAKNDTTIAQSEVSKHVTTIPQPRPRGRPRKLLTTEKMPKLQANLEKLKKKRILEVSKEIESKTQFPNLLAVTDVSTPAKKHAQTCCDEALTSIAKETESLSPLKVVEEDINIQLGKKTNSIQNDAEAKLKHPLEKNAASTKIDERDNNKITQQGSNKHRSTECDVLNSNVSIENAADSQVCLKQIEGEVKINPKQTKQHDEPDELIVRVPLAALTEEFQRLHFSINIPRDNVTERECNSPPQNSDSADVAKVNRKTAATGNWLRAENQNETETENKNDEHAFLETQINFCESAAAEECSEFPGARFLDLEQRAEIIEVNAVNSVEAPSSQNDSDQSEFYGFANDSDAASAAAASAYANPAQNTNSISSQINDYINDFQTHCLSGDEKSTPSHSFQHDNDEQRTCLPSVETSRNCTQLLDHNNVIDNYVDNTLNGLLNDIQDQNIFSPSTTPLVTMESEDFHHHSSYSPLSEGSDQTHSTHQDFIKSNLCDLSDPGPTVNPSHTIEVIGRRDEHGNMPQNVFAGQHHYNNYVECFTEDSTQSELIGFQNDIPCFENIELNSSTPRHSSTPPPPTVTLTMPPTTTACIRNNNSALQGAIQQHAAKQLDYNLRQGEVGNVQYLGLANESDLCTSLTADAMGLVCTTSSGVQMHTPTLTNPIAAQQKFEGSFENDLPTPEAGENASKEYAVDRATLQLTQIFSEMPAPESGSSSSQVITNVVRDVSKKNSVLSKYVGSSTSKRLIYPKKSVTEQNALNSSAKQHYVTLVPNDSGSNNAQLSLNDSAQEMLNIGNAKYTLYTEVLPQELQWQSPSTVSGTQDQQTTTTTYYINAAELHQSNLISTTTISVSPLIAGADVGAESNLTLLPTQLAHQSTSTGVAMQAPSNDVDKRSVDANENYIEGMQNQPIMIVFPPDYINDAPSVSAVYNPAANQVTITPLQTTINASLQPQITNPVSAPTNNVTQTVLSSSPAPSIAAATIPSPHSKHQQQKVNLSCRFCHKRPKFTNNLDYSNHIIATHPGENPFNCPQCPMFFTRRALRQQHIVEAHGSNRFHCAQCGQSFCAQRTLDMHLQRYHAPTDASCSSKKQMQTKQSQPWHERSSIQQQVNVEDVHLQVAEEQHCENTNNDDNPQLATDSSSSTANKPPHRILGCPDCDDSFEDLDSQEPHTHQITSHSHNQSLSHTSNSGPTTMPSPEQTEPDSTSTTTLRQFRKQRLSSKSSSSSTDIPERVLRNSHQCIFCDEQFTNESTLRKHHQSVHGNETSLPFVCTMCKRGFRMRTALQRHMETHDSVGRPYECSICLVRFPRPSQLTLHKLTVHFLRKPHACQICGKQFGTESALKTHEKFHGENKLDCDDECHKKCLLKKDLRKYRRVHIGDNFYKCDFCPTTFAHYTRLCAHLKSHLPVGMYNEDPPMLQRERQREMKELEQQQQSESAELNETNVESELNDPLNSSA